MSRKNPTTNAKQRERQTKQLQRLERVVDTKTGDERRVIELEINDLRSKLKGQG